MSMAWGEQFKWREKVHERYPEIWDLGIVRKRLPFLLRYLKDGEAVLDIGAFDRSLGQRLKRERPALIYKSLDIDPTYRHDYASLDQVLEKFDVALLFEVVEHLDWSSGQEMIRKVHGILNPGGRVIVSTPNIYTPGQYWKDASHRTPFHYEELGALFLNQHFELVEIRRLAHEPLAGYVLKACFFRPLFRFLGIDFSKSILLVARKA
jgi:SAM-dependent methyltransferase